MFNVLDLNLKTPQLPRGNKLIVLPLVKAGASIIIDMEENREMPEKGLVLAIGPGGCGAETGLPIPVDAKVGELVCYGKFSGLKFEIAGPRGPVKVFIMRDTEVLLAQPAATLDLVVHDNDPSRIHEAGLTCEYCPRVEGEAGVERLRAISRGENPDGVTDVGDDEHALIDSERLRDPGPNVVLS